MEILGAAITADAACATYDDRKHQFIHWTPKYLDPISDGYTSGFVASDDRITILAFRGTQNSLSPMDAFIACTRQWLTNIDYAQREKDGFKVHRGFDEQLDSVYNQVIKSLKAHDADRRPFVVTGHSAGAALATLAAYRLSCDDLKPDAVYLFASPRVGNGEFGETLRKRMIPVYRFEQRDDLVAHLPFSPGLSRLLGNAGVDRLVESLSVAFPNFDFYNYRSTAVEYLHVGKLFFRDWEGRLLSCAEWDELPDAFSAEIDENGVFTTVPKDILDGVRFLATLNNVADQLDDWVTRVSGGIPMLGKLRFLADHNLPDLHEFLLQLAQRRI